ncbi:hypothetical protein CFC21_085540 [Triticum aestivum]|uniref:PGG domain-containing protein n=2 Tax=Triticum aestivum TaxID=4565 RepID=A0A9R1IE83_WHEAT|nr:hypothetical protein CFC21_085540 [Triticum aestivum]
MAQREIQLIVAEGEQAPNAGAGSNARGAGGGARNAAPVGSAAVADNVLEPVLVQASKKDTVLEQAKDDEEFLNKMRGWLMAVATLFVGFAFQAAMHPPDWMPKDYCFGDWWRVGTRQPFRLRYESFAAPMFILLNTMTFATGLVLLKRLLAIEKTPATSDMNQIRFMVASLSGCGLVTYVSGISNDPFAASMVLASLLAYIVAARVVLRAGPPPNIA